MDVFLRYPETFAILDRIFKGEKAFIFSSTIQEILFENLFIAKYGPVGYPLRRVIDK